MKTGSERSEHQLSWEIHGSGKGEKADIKDFLDRELKRKSVLGHGDMQSSHP